MEPQDLHPKLQAGNSYEYVIRSRVEKQEHRETYKASIDARFSSGDSVNLAVSIASTRK